MVTQTPNPLPRELAPGVFWLGECLIIPSGNRIFHSYSCAYLVVGRRHSAFVEAGVTTQSATIIDQADALLRDNAFPAPAYVFVTHSEMAHAGGVGHILSRYPEATAHGDVSDLDFVFPEFADRMHFAEPGDRFDLGETEIVVVESVFRDLVHSRWYFDTGRRVLFPGDGFAYSHEHKDGACGHVAEEVPAVDISAQMARFTQAAFHWTQFVDIEPYIARLDQVVFDQLGTALIAPAHGLPITDPVATMPKIKAGLRFRSDER